MSAIQTNQNAGVIAITFYCKNIPKELDLFYIIFFLLNYCREGFICASKNAGLVGAD